MLYRIRPFKHDGQWVFTDIGVDLDKEPLVQGIDLMFDELTKDIPDADTGFELVFSDRPFEGAMITLDYVRPGEVEGNWYHCPELCLDGWLCPNLKKYFAEPPARLFMQAKFLRKPNVFSYPLSMREPSKFGNKPAETRPMSALEARAWIEQWLRRR